MSQVRVNLYPHNPPPLHITNRGKEGRMRTLRREVESEDNPVIGVAVRLVFAVLLIAFVLRLSVRHEPEYDEVEGHPIGI